jgi:hypothetical protein
MLPTRGQRKQHKGIAEGHSQCAPASGISQGEREQWAMAVKDGGQRRSTEVLAADGSGQQRTLAKQSAFEES